MDKEKKKLNKKRIIILTIAAFYLLTAAALVYFFDRRTVCVYLMDGDELTVEYGGEFKDPGEYAVTTGRLFGESKRHLKLSTEGTVDGSELGEYQIKYRARFLFRDYTAVRRVTVVDTVAPVIELKYTEGGGGSWFTGFEEEGYTATDNHDGDISSKVTRQVNSDRIIYTVSDQSGNTSSVERESYYNATAPVISLEGESDIVINARMSYSLPGFSAVDSQGNDLSQYVKLEGEFYPYRAGTYELKYVITNDVGDTVSATRSITVEANSIPETVTPPSGTVYLTFDDGPGPYTDQLLDLLAQYDAKATFFVTNGAPAYKDKIARAYREGHSIGVHTYSHNYGSIYSGEDAFFNDFNAMEEVIFAQTGHYTQLCRFPGGSSNTVSSFNPGIMSRLAASLTDLGYCYYDWNVSSGDAGQTRDTDQIAANIIVGCQNVAVPVVLQHDIKDYSVAAVEQVLIWGQENGYSFRALDPTSPGAHHGIAN